MKGIIYDGAENIKTAGRGIYGTLEKTNIFGGIYAALKLISMASTTGATGKTLLVRDV